MARIIDLKSLLPQLMTEYTELDGIMTVETTELNGVEVEHEALVNNRYIHTCNEDGVARFEHIMSIIPNSNDTLVDRQFRCISKWNQTIPYNYKVLDEKLALLCGEGAYELIVDFTNQSVHIKLALVNENQFQSVVDLVNSIVPCNMLINVNIMYNTHEVLSKLTHERMSAYTHAQLRSQTF